MAKHCIFTPEISKSFDKYYILVMLFFLIKKQLLQNVISSQT